MLYLKRLNLRNYCSYEEHSFDFVKPDGSPYKYICFYGPNGIGKCCSGDTYVIVQKKPCDSIQMCQISELFPDNLTEDTWYDANFDIYTGHGHKFKPVKKIYYNGKKPSLALTTSCGFSITGSSDRHQILAVREGEIQFVKLSDLKVDDYIHINRTPLCGNIPISDSIARILGYLIAEGDCHLNRWRFTNYDQEILEDYQECIKEYFSIQAEIKRDHIDVHKKQTDVLSLCGLTKEKSGEKSVPTIILEADDRGIHNFLRAYFEGDGGVEHNIQAVTCCSKSHRLMKQIHLLLLRCGIVSVLSKKNQTYNSAPYLSWRVVIQGENVQKYADKIGFVSTRKNKELHSLLSPSTTHNPNKDILPKELAALIIEEMRQHVDKNGLIFSRIQHKQTWNGLHCLQPSYINTVKNGVSRDKISRCMATTGFKGNDYLYKEVFFDKVVSIEQKNTPLFDLSVDDDHYYWSDGFISHNSTLLEAISMLTANWSGRGDMFIKQSLQKYVRNKDYDPAWQKVIDAGKQKVSKEMLIEGVYDLAGQEHIIQLTQDGYVRNDFAPIHDPDLEDEDKQAIIQSGPWGEDHLKHRQRIAHFMKSDSDLSMHKFQLHHSQKDKYEKIISTIMRYPARVTEPSGFTSDERSYCVDVTIEKKGHKIHFKRMSAGERKICKSFSEIFNTMQALEHPSPGERAMPGWPPLLLIDNVVMHIYYDRHVQMIDCLKEVFEKQQIFATTHSGVLIQRFLSGENDQSTELMIDLEQFNG